MGLEKKSSWVRKLKTRYTNYVLTYKWLLALKDNHSTIHKLKEPMQQGGLKTGGTRITWIFLVMGNRIDIKSGLGAGGDWNRRNLIGKDEGRES